MFYCLLQSVPISSNKYARLQSAQTNIIIALRSNASARHPGPIPVRPCIHAMRVSPFFCFVLRRRSSSTATRVNQRRDRFKHSYVHFICVCVCVWVFHKGGPSGVVRSLARSVGRSVGRLRCVCVAASSPLDDPHRWGAGWMGGWQPEKRVYILPLRMRLRMRKFMCAVRYIFAVGERQRARERVNGQEREGEEHCT